MRATKFMILSIAAFFVVPLLWLAGYQAKQSFDLLGSTDRATGAITGFGDRGDPVIEFEYKGAKYRMTQQKVSDLMKFEVGSREEVLVEPLDPEHSTLNRFGNLWGGTVATLSFAAFASLMGYFIWRIR